MKKEFLDFIYDLRSRVSADIERLIAKAGEPKGRCCNDMSDQDERLAELRTRRSQLSSIDDTIKSYINLHSNPQPHQL